MPPSPHKTSLLQRLSWPDLIAGLSLAGLLLPEAVAYSSIANLSPQAGVIALFAGLVCYGLIGTSRFAIVSATSSSAVVLAAASASVAGPDAAFRVVIAFALVLVTGAFFTIAGAARLGGVTDFIAKPVLRGFAFGLAIVIVAKQVASVAGIAPQHGDMPRYVFELVSRHAEWNPMAATVAAAALALLILLGRVRALPAGLLVLIAGIAAGKWLNLAQYGIALVGQIDLRTELPTLPNLRYSDWLKVAELSVALLLILYAESYSAIRGFALKHGDQTAPNRDLIAFGAANLVSGLLHGMPVGAGYSATSANEAAGAQSRLAGGYAALALLAIVLTMLPAIALTPQPVLAAIVIYAVGHSLSPAVFRSYFTLHRDDHHPVAVQCEIAAAHGGTERVADGVDDDGGQHRLRRQRDRRQHRQHDGQQRQRRVAAGQPRLRARGLVGRRGRVAGADRHAVQQAGDQVGRAERDQVAIGRGLVAVLEREAAYRAVRFGVQNQQQRHAQFRHFQPVGIAQIGQRRQLGAQVDLADQRDAVLRQVEPLAGGDAGDEHQQPGRQRAHAPQ